MTRKYVIGARGSRLSLVQVQLVIDALRAAHGNIEIETREIKTKGDRTSAPLSQIGGLGVFTKAIEDALLAGEIDVAVHSLKDLPPQLPEGLVLGAVPERGDVRDALVTRNGTPLSGLPPSARIGTGSERRSVQLKVLRGDMQPVEIRGNVPTRIAKVESGEYDGAVLALAGLQRLGLDAKAAQIFSVEQMTPAVGQGALGVETRADDAETLALVSAIDHAGTRAAVTAERAFLARLGAGCRMPVGGYATDSGGGMLQLTVMLADGLDLRRRQIVGSRDEAESLGTRLAEEMIAHGEVHV